MVQIKKYVITKILCNIAFVVVFCMSNIVQAERAVGSDIENQFIQLPTRSKFKEILHNAQLDEILEKTGIIEILYHNKESFQSADPVSLDRLVKVVDAIYDEYAIVEGHMPARVKLVNRSKPLLYEILLVGNPAALKELHNRGIL